MGGREGKKERKWLWEGEKGWRRCRKGDRNFREGGGERLARGRTEPGWEDER